MVVLMLEKVPAGLRGELSRWMIEPRTGVFVGRVSGMVRDRLWDKAVKGARGGSGMLLYDSPNEQGFAVRTFGDTGRKLVDWEGLMLVYVPRHTRQPPIEAPSLDEGAQESVFDEGE